MYVYTFHSGGTLVSTLGKYAMALFEVHHDRPTIRRQMTVDAAAHLRLCVCVWCVCTGASTVHRVTRQSDAIVIASRNYSLSN